MTTSIARYVVIAIILPVALAIEPYFRIKEELELRNIDIYQHIRRLAKFFTAGAIGIPVHLGVLWGLTEAGLWYIFSAVIATLTAMTFNYIVNHYWAFADLHTSSIARGWVKYLLVAVLCEGLYLGLLYIAVDVLGLYYLLSAGGIIVMLGLLRYFLVRRYIWRSVKAPLTQ